MFKRFLDPRVVSELIESGEIDWKKDAAACDVTVLFSDIRGFTTLSEAAGPEQVVAMLNSYFSRQVDVIFHHGARQVHRRAIWLSGAPRSLNLGPCAAGSRGGNRHLGDARTLAQRDRRTGPRARNRHRGPHRQGGGRLRRLGRTARLHRHRRYGEPSSRIEGQTKGVAQISVSRPRATPQGPASTGAITGCTVKGRDSTFASLNPCQSRVTSGSDPAERYMMQRWVKSSVAATSRSLPPPRWRARRAS